MTRTQQKKQTKSGLQDHILDASYQPPDQVRLVFADGLEGTWPLSGLSLDLSNMKLDSIKPTAKKTHINIKSKWGDDVAIDASALRAMVDPEYAEKMKSAFMDSRGPLADLKM